MIKKTHFERAIFLSWYCSRGDCKFCYMSTQKPLIKDPKKARRTTESVLAEVFLCKLLGWRIEFLSGGYESYSIKELRELFNQIYKIYKKKIWLNIGVLNKEELELFKPYIKGVCGAVECINPKVQKKVCPSKPIEEIELMYRICDELNLKKAMTIILGIGESEKDISLLKRFIRKHNIYKITFYRLKPQKNTEFEDVSPIKKEYYAEWVRKIRQEFPKLKITVGSWLTHLDEIDLLLESGADAITKFPSIKLFNSKHAKIIESEVKKNGRKFQGSLTKLPKISYNTLNKAGFDKKTVLKIKAKIKQYLEILKKRN